jgi:hypothetical protein
MGERFIQHVNAWNGDSLAPMLSNDFMLRRNFTGITNTKADFLGSYLKNSQKLHGRYRVVEKLSQSNPEVFLVEDESDFFSYLMIESIQWKLSVHTNKQNLIDEVRIDSTAGYAAYAMAARFVTDKFNRWLEENHPGETSNTLIADTTDLYTRRMIEFRRAN